MKMKTIGIFVLTLVLFASSLSFVAAKPNEGKMRSCQAKEESIKKRLTSLNNLAANMESKFDSIAARVKDYYTSKVLPSGKTVANYDALVSEIGTKKSSVQTSLTTAQTNSSNFSCDGDDPKAQLTQFREDMQVVKSALKDYRMAIKNLIVAVRSNNEK